MWALQLEFYLCIQLGLCVKYERDMIIWFLLLDYTKKNNYDELLTVTKGDRKKGPFSTSSPLKFQPSVWIGFCEDTELIKRFSHQKHSSLTVKFSFVNLALDPFLIGALWIYQKWFGVIPFSFSPNWNYFCLSFSIQGLNVSTWLITELSIISFILFIIDLLLDCCCYFLSVLHCNKAFHKNNNRSFYLPIFPPYLRK